MGQAAVYYLTLLVCAALIGLIPLLLGRYLRKPRLGGLGMFACVVSVLLHPSLPLLTAIAFVLALFLIRRDIWVTGSSWPPDAARIPSGPAPDSGTGLQLLCLSGPLKGQVYSLGAGGLVLGRDNHCTVRFPPNTAGISRQHCRLGYQQGVPVLVDLNSAYGTFWEDGRRLPPQDPRPLTPGCRFYLGSPNCLFQIIQ